MHPSPHAPAGRCVPGPRAQRPGHAPQACRLSGGPPQRAPPHTFHALQDAACLAHVFNTPATQLLRAAAMAAKRGDEERPLLGGLASGVRCGPAWQSYRCCMVLLCTLLAAMPSAMPSALWLEAVPWRPSGAMRSGRCWTVAQLRKRLQMQSRCEAFFASASIA